MNGRCEEVEKVVPFVWSNFTFSVTIEEHTSKYSDIQKVNAYNMC